MIEISIMQSIKVISKFLLDKNGDDLIYLVPYTIVDGISPSIVFRDNLTLLRDSHMTERNSDIVYISIGQR